jgi:hypothetical protein
MIILNFSSYGQIFKDKYIKDATNVAEIWLNNINTSKYNLAYSQYSKEVKENSDSIQWLKAITQLTNEFGELKSRKIVSAKFESNIEGLGDGFYVFIEYMSIYKKVNECNEYLILGQNDKIKWKILRYDFSYKSQELDDKYYEKELPN